MHPEEGYMRLLEEAYAAANKLADRSVEVEKLKNGKYIVLWMAFEQAPPSPGDTELEALCNFIDMMKSKVPLPAPPEDVTI